MPEQDVSVELYYDSGWQQVADRTFVSDQITVQRGQGAEGAALRPSSTALTFNDDDRRFSVAHPSSPLYAKAGRNTPVQVSVAGGVVNVTEATTWQPTRTIDATVGPPARGRAEVALESYGVLGRINQWTERSRPLRSPWHRFLMAQDDLVGYWPLEDPRGTLYSVQNMVPGSSNEMTNMDFDSQRRFAGSDPCADMGPVAYSGSDNFRFTVAPCTTGTDDGWMMVWAARMPESTAGEFALIRVTDDRGRLYTVNMLNPGQMHVTIVGDGVSLDQTLSTVTSLLGSLDVTQWNLYKMKVAPNGANVDVGISWSREGVMLNTGFTCTYAGETNRPRSGSIPGVGSGAMEGGTWGHVAVFQVQSTLFNSGPALIAFMGHEGELGADRFERLMDEEGIPYDLLGLVGDTFPMGPQRSGTLTGELQMIRDTDDGMIFDAKDVLGLVLRTRLDLYARTPKLALTFGLNVAYPFVEILDDLEVTNIMAVQNRDRGSYEVEETTGPLSTQAPPDGVGEYKGGVDVSVAVDSNLVDMAWWFLNRRTVETPRFTTVTVDLVANPELVDDVAAVDIGDRITVAGYFPDLIDLMVIGYTDRTGSHTRKVTFVTVPYRQFDVGIYHADGASITSALKRYDSKTSTLSTGYSSSATTLVVSFTTLTDAWSTVNEPYDWIVAGERITVTSMGAVTGSGPWTQTATVTRAVNGVSKAQASGEAVTMHPDQQARYAL